MFLKMTLCSLLSLTTCLFHGAPYVELKRLYIFDPSSSIIYCVRVYGFCWDSTRSWHLYGFPNISLFTQWNERGFSPNLFQNTELTRSDRAAYFCTFFFKYTTQKGRTAIRYFSRIWTAGWRCKVCKSRDSELLKGDRLIWSPSTPSFPRWYKDHAYMRVCLGAR